MNRRRKLIEVALPLKEINEQSVREKSIRHGHPSTLHPWWARRPLAACRAVLFAQLVDDPSSDPAYRRPDGSVDEDQAGIKRAELFNLIEELVRWENSNNPRIINAARAEIARCVASRKIELGELKKETIIYSGDRRQESGDRIKEGNLHPDGPLPDDGRWTAWQICCRMAPPEAVNHFLAKYAPPVLDPFAGGGSIPLEAQRLGLRAHASDLNPVPVLINKALIEIPPKFAGLPPVNPGSTDTLSDSKELFEKDWHGARGLAEDVRYYGKWMRDEAEKRIGHLYPKVKITQEMVDDGRPDLKPYLGQELTVIAWLWARTVASPDPSVGGKHVPLVRSFWLSKKKGKETYVRPVVDRKKGTYEFKVRVGKPADGFDPDKGTKPSGRGSNFECILSGSPIDGNYIKSMGQSEGLQSRLMAVVCEGVRGRIYLNPIEEMELTAREANPLWKPEFDLIGKSADQLPLYGMKQYWQLFTPRQLTALTTFSDLVAEARKKVLEGGCVGQYSEDRRQETGGCRRTF
jgi:putative DNA methylase